MNVTMRFVSLQDTLTTGMIKAARRAIIEKRHAILQHDGWEMTEASGLPFEETPPPSADSGVASRFVAVAKVGTIPEGQGCSFVVSGRQIAIFCRGGEYFATSDFCPHMGAPIADGYVDVDGGVVCPWHAWKFRLSDGCWLDNPKSKTRLECFAVRINGETIEVALPENQGAATSVDQ
ncbi:3-phenylpropionate/cinnamic acid dioxygenase ferredoxin subunit [Planctopirus ephydatiae]|uniref:3-phenylpropionate/cinnamic acid dioxygenase ferredoxin subunit n=2 Tax=Planctopirus ephydatiae TaxID=2528019 RepID=A0A518GTL9_9PLAN|nr:3-phenylpropionate/cinnamic acid dioxygenase ferredoxin subunit [Planctopirus ephydatiae]